jgi:YVTN family beta-propeller protein
VLTVAAVALAAGAFGRRESSAVLAPNSLGVIDPETNRLVGQVRVGELPIRVAAGEGGIWVLNAGDRTVSRVDPQARKVVRTIPLAGRAEPMGLAAGADGVWVGRGRAGTLTVARISPAFNEVMASTSLGTAEQPFYAARWAVAVGHRSVWAPGGRFGTVLRLDPLTRRVRATIDTGVRPAAIAVAPGATWITGSRNLVVRIDPRTNKVVGRLRVPTGAWAVAAGAGAAWVTAAHEDVVARIDATTHTVTTIRVGDLPTAVAVGEGSVWVANAGDGTVSRIDPTTREVVETIELGASPEAIAVGHGVVWVATSTRRGG